MPHKSLPTQNLLQVSFRHTFISITSFMVLPNSKTTLHKTFLLTESQAFFNPTSLTNCLTVFTVFPKYLVNAEYLMSSTTSVSRSTSTIHNTLPLHMKLALTEGCWMEFCAQMIAVTHHENYYTPFYNASYKQVKRSNPSTAHVIPPYPKYI